MSSETPAPVRRPEGFIATTPPTVVKAPPRPGEVRRIAIDPSRAEALLGWRAQTALAEGLDITLGSLSARTGRPAGRAGDR